MKTALPVILLFLLLGQVVHLPVRALWLESKRDSIAQDLCSNRDKPELMCQGNCYIGRMVAEAIESGPSGDMPPVSLQKELLQFPFFLPGYVYFPAAASDVFPPQPFYQASSLFFTPLQGIFRPPRYA